MEFILLPQSPLEFGYSSLGAGQPCGVSLRSLHLDGQFHWEVILRSYDRSLRSNRTLVRRLVEQSSFPDLIRFTYNYGVIALELGAEDSLVAHLDNFCTEIREITIRNSGLPLRS